MTSIISRYDVYYTLLGVKIAYPAVVAAYSCLTILSRTETANNTGRRLLFLGPKASRLPGYGVRLPRHANLARPRMIHRSQAGT